MPVPAGDLDWLEREPWKSQLSEGLRGATVFATGATGFMGTWLLCAFAAMVNRLQVDAVMHVLSRDPERFRRAHPALGEHHAIRWHQGDVRSATLSGLASATHVVHAATDVQAIVTGRAQDDDAETIVEGTRNVVGVARRLGARRFLFLSSGAVHPAPDGTISRYGVAKREAESIVRDAEGAFIARGYAFVGPHLPLSRHFAMGSLLSDALAGEELVVRGDGTAVRSFMYGSDLARWLWVLLLRGSAGDACDVGAARGLSIAELAQLIARVAGTGKGYRVLGQAAPGNAPSVYLPDLAAARSYGLEEEITLEDAVAKTLAWKRTELRTAK